MITDKRVDKEFKEKYFLKGRQITVMQRTYSYQVRVLQYQFKDLWEAIKSEFRRK